METSAPEENAIFAPEARGDFGNDNQQDYFGFAATDKFTFPDGKTFIEFTKMNEGKKKDFQDKTSKDLVLERNSGNARMSVLQGTERHELIKACVVNWNLVRGGQPVQFNQVALNDFLTLADPVIVEGLEKAIRKANPWLLGEMSVSDIDKEIVNLQEMREVAVKREAGEAN
jgi:hypothetical protein